jgi:16S rRNA (adenine1518-N6/adenine1519-N6)-dimethyltransferase
VEIDSGFFRYLVERYGKRKNFRLVHGDFLKVPVSEGFTKIVSNLPYYCSSEMLFKIAQYNAAAVYVTLQKEMAQRIVARPGHSAYGALSVTLGFYYVPEILFTVSREAFYPLPGVTSSFLRLMRRAAFPLNGEDVDLFHRIVKSAFWGRRKTIRTALSESPHLEAGRKVTALILAQAGINGGNRGEDLGLEDYVRMVHAFRKAMQ